MNSPESEPPFSQLDWPRRTGRLDQMMEALEVRKRRRKRNRRTVGAVIGACVLVAAGLQVFQRPKNLPDSHAVARVHPLVTAPEERTLPDGSIVELKDGSLISLDFGGRLRRVSLLRGEAHFQVAKNANRPFVVQAGAVEFRAVGTAFDVQLGATQVQMIVTEGRVAVDRDASGSSGGGRRGLVPDSDTLAIVNAGNQVAVDLATKRLIPEASKQLTALESEQELVWRVPRLDLNDTPLAEAVVAINQYSPMRLELGDKELGKVGISGKLRADNVDTLLRMLEINYGIRGDRGAPGKIVLRKAP